MVTRIPHAWRAGLATMALLSAACGGHSPTAPVPATQTPSPSEQILVRAAPLCTAAFSAAAPSATAQPRAPLIALRQRDVTELKPEFQGTPSAGPAWRGTGYQADHDVPLELDAKSGDAAQTLVCVTERYIQVGTYEKSGSAAVRIDHDVNLVRLGDGAVLAHRRFAGGDPPESRNTSSTGFRTIDNGSEPSAAVSAWLEQVVAR